MNEGRICSEQERLSLALSSAEMGTWDWDVHTGVMWWDEGMHARFALTPGNFKGTYEEFLGLIHEEDRESIRAEFTHAIAERTLSIPNFECLGRRMEAFMWSGFVHACIVTRIPRAFES